MLHIDKNDYYGGAEAALSLQEVEAWADTVIEGSFNSQLSGTVLKNKQVRPSDMLHTGIGSRKESHKQREMSPQSWDFLEHTASPCRRS